MNMIFGFHANIKKFAEFFIFFWIGRPEVIKAYAEIFKILSVVGERFGN